MLHRIAILMLAVMIFPAFARTSVRDSIVKWKPGQRIEVTLMSGEKLVGKRGEIKLDSFVLEPDKKAQTARELRFDDLRSATTKWTTGHKLAVGLIVYAGISVLFAILLGN